MRVEIAGRCTWACADRFSPAVIAIASRGQGEGLLRWEVSEDQAVWASCLSLRWRLL